MLRNSMVLDKETPRAGIQGWQSSQADTLLADATAHLVEAYEAIDELSRNELSAVEFSDIPRSLSVSLRHVGGVRRIF